MPQPRIYIETSVISYYTSRPSRNVVVAGHQAVTVEWWERDLAKFVPLVSSVVLDEIGAGNATEAAKRMTAVADWGILDLTSEAESLAIEYFSAITLPEAARADALHLALATWHGTDYLTTWNCRHIANARVRKVVERINDRRGFETPVICTPEELLEF